ncbi:unnamed protein product, partial [marine sediment metagenome]
PRVRNRNKAHAEEEKQKKPLKRKALQAPSPIPESGCDESYYDEIYDKNVEMHIKKRGDIWLRSEPFFGERFQKRGVALLNRKKEREKA